MPAPHIVLCDTEYTTFDDPLGAAAFSANPSTDVPREIVQIGALKLCPHTLDVQDSFEVLVKPVINPQLSDFFISLTGITQADVDKDGLSFSDAYKKFRHFAGADFQFVAHGTDWQVFELNLYLNTMPPETLPAAPVDIRPFINRHAPETVGVNSGRLTEVLGIRPRYKEHTGLADCHSIREAILHLMAQGAPNPFMGA